MLGFYNTQWTKLQFAETSKDNLRIASCVSVQKCDNETRLPLSVLSFVLLETITRSSVFTQAHGIFSVNLINVAWGSIHDILLKIFVHIFILVHF